MVSQYPTQPGTEGQQRPVTWPARWQAGQNRDNQVRRGATGGWSSHMVLPLSGAFLSLFLRLGNGMQETTVISQGFQGLRWVVPFLLYWQLQGQGLAAAG